MRKKTMKNKRAGSILSPPLKKSNEYSKYLKR